MSLSSPDKPEDDSSHERSQSMPPEREPTGAVRPEQISTTLGHRWFVLIGISFLVFEVGFLLLYGSDFWFETDIAWIGIPAIGVALLVAHFLLSWSESPAGCRFFAPIWKGRPPLVYRRWLQVSDTGFAFGNRRVIWAAIDELRLTFFGNLQVLSRAVCGSDPPEPDLVLKFPLGSASTAAQQDFIEKARSRNSSVTVNKRLTKRLSTREIRGAALVQAGGAVFMLLILLDVGNSTFSYLEMMKGYYLAQTEARDGNLGKARQHFQAAERLRNNPFPVSWVTTKLLSRGVVAAGVQQERSEALWRLGKKNESIAAARQALEYAPDRYRFNLRLARLLANNGNLREARAQIRLAIANHDDSLLPRLYMLALLKTGDNPEEAARMYELYLQELVDLVFGQEPMWPPGGNRFLHELFYQDDTTFILDRLIRKRNTDTEHP